jgi:hypothetical protein
MRVGHPRRGRLRDLVRSLRLVEQAERREQPGTQRLRRVLGLHAFARGAELPRPIQRGRYQDRPGHRDQPADARVPCRAEDVLQTAAGGRPTAGVAERGAQDAEARAVHARARPDRLSGPDDRPKRRAAVGAGDRPQRLRVQAHGRAEPPIAGIPARDDSVRRAPRAVIAQRPSKLVGRPSTNALTPSMKSAVAACSCWMLASSSSCSSIPA